MAIGSCRTSPGTQIDLGGVLPNTTLLVFQMDVARDVCVDQEVDEPGNLSTVDGQMGCPGGSKSWKVSRGFCWTRTTFLAGLTGSHSFWTWLNILHKCGQGVTGFSGLLVRI